jgi:hypothetical protein
VGGDTLGRSLASQTILPNAGPSSDSPGGKKDRAHNNLGKRQNAVTKRAPARDSMHEARQLLRSLNYDPRTTSGDVETCLRLGERLDEDNKARAVAMIQNARFGEFMAEYLASSSLLVNGRADLSSTEGLSPLSFVAAKLVRISEGIDAPSGSPYVVEYFCNQHLPFSSSSPIPPPVEMMASLFSQLLAQMIEKGLDVDLSMLTMGDWQKIQKLNLKALCDIFRELTYQLPPNSVLLCVIDDLARYEITPFMRETDAIIRRLTRLVQKHEQIVFKLLVTCEGRALEISKYFTNQTVDLDEEIEHDDSASWKFSRFGG